MFDFKVSEPALLRVLERIARALERIAGPEFDPAEAGPPRGLSSIVHSVRLPEDVLEEVDALGLGQADRAKLMAELRNAAREHQRQLPNVR